MPRDLLTGHGASLVPGLAEHAGLSAGHVAVPRAPGPGTTPAGEASPGAVGD